MKNLWKKWIFIAQFHFPDPVSEYGSGSRLAIWIRIRTTAKQRRYDGSRRNLAAKTTFKNVFVSVGKGGDAGDATSKDESVDVVGSLVRVHRFQVHHMPVTCDMCTHVT